MEPGIFCTIPFALFFFWLGWLLLKQLKHSIKSGGFQLGGGEPWDVTYIKRDKNPIVFYFFFNSNLFGLYRLTPHQHHGCDCCE